MKNKKLLINKERGIFPYIFSQFLSFSISLFLIFLPIICLGVEGMDIDIPYPLTPPKVLFGEIKDLQYIHSKSRIATPLFHLLSEANGDFIYNFYTMGGIHHINSQYKIEAERREVALINNYETGNLRASFNREEDSLSLEYKNMTWYDLSKEITSFTTHFTMEMEGYFGEVSSHYNYFESKNDYHFSIQYHKLYGYANMLSTEFSYIHSSFLRERDKIFRIIIKDRFSFRDYIYLIPGIKADFISQTLFTPFFQSIYLINKNLSLKSTIQAKSYESNISDPFDLPHVTFPESLTTPTKILHTSLYLDIFMDSTLSIALGTSVQKIENPIISVQNRRYSLSFENIDTTITFSDISLSINLDRSLFSLHPKLIITTTPFYDQYIPYYPKYRLNNSIIITPIRQISFANNIYFTAMMHDNEGRELKKCLLISSFIIFNASKNVSFQIGALNITDNRDQFIRNVYYPGRIFKSGINITI